MNFPTIVDIEPTSVCNLSCPFCFGPTDVGRSNDMMVNSWYKILNKLVSYGVKGIVISGGEPTLYKDLNLLVRRAKQLGLSVVVSTHGRFEKKVLSIAEYCDWIALPIDGFTDDINTIMRGDRWGFSEYARLVEKLKSKNPKLKIKLGTVATLINQHELYQMFEYVDQEGVYNLFDTWKIYEYTPRRKFKQLKKSLQFNGEEFNILKEDFEKKKYKYYDKVYFSHVKEHESGYVFIYHDGVMNICDVGPNLIDIQIGDFKKGEFKLENLKYLNNVNHLSNYNKTYVE